MIVNEQKSNPLLKVFWDYLRCPVPSVKDNTIWYLKIFNVIRLWSMSFALGLSFAFISGVLLQGIGYDESDFAINQLFQEVSPFVLLFLAVVGASISEEIGFRLGLKFSPIRWGLGIAIFAYFMILFFDFPFLYGIFGELNFATLAFFIFTSVSISLILSLPKIKLVVQRFFHNNYRFFYYSLAILFGFIHIANYQENWLSILHLAPFLVMPQIILAFVISFIRMHYGFLWAVIAHGLNNLVALGIILLFYPIITLDVDLEKVDDMEILRHLSISEIFSIGAGSFAFFGVFIIIILSGISLIIEVYNYRRGD